MTSPLQYGRTVTEEVIANYAVAKRVTQYVEIVRVKDDKDILAEFLKLLDAQSTGLIDNIGLQCIRNMDTGRIRIEKSWSVVTDLQ